MRAAGLTDSQVRMELMARNLPHSAGAAANRVRLARAAEREDTVEMGRAKAASMRKQAKQQTEHTAAARIQVRDIAPLPASITCAVPPWRAAIDLWEIQCVQALARLRKQKRRFKITLMVARKRKRKAAVIRIQVLPAPFHTHSATPRCTTRCLFALLPRLWTQHP